MGVFWWEFFDGRQCSENGRGLKLLLFFFEAGTTLSSFSLWGISNPFHLIFEVCLICRCRPHMLCLEFFFESHLSLPPFLCHVSCSFFTMRTATGWRNFPQGGATSKYCPPGTFELPGLAACLFFDKKSRVATRWAPSSYKWTWKQIIVNWGLWPVHPTYSW